MSISQQTIGVIGLGLIGASILKDIRNHAPSVYRYGLSIGHEQYIARSESLIEEILSFDELVNRCDLIFIATPISNVIDIARKIKKQKKTKKNLIVTDVASVKIDISNEFEKLTSSNVTYISSHPMGGSEKSGYEGSRGGMFRNKPWIICDLEANGKDYELLKEVIRTVCHAKLYFMPADIHDKRVAVISHMILDMSHYIFEFVNSKHPEAMNIAGESFITTTRLASDNPRMLDEINTINGKEINSIFKEFIEFLTLKQETGQPNMAYFRSNKQARDSWIHYRNKGH